MKRNVTFFCDEDVESVGVGTDDEDEEEEDDDVEEAVEDGDDDDDELSKYTSVALCF